MVGWLKKVAGSKWMWKEGSGIVAQLKGGLNPAVVLDELID